MADPSVDLLALNRQILMDPTAAGSNELVALLELEQPGLEFLCPMARAIYWMETNRHGRIDANEILRTLWFIDDSDANRDEDRNEDSEGVFEESARHTIDLSWGGVGITLEFESHSVMFFYRCLDSPGEIRAHCAAYLSLSPQDDASPMIRDLFRTFDSERRRFRVYIRGDPSSKEFVGTCYYRFAFVNGIPVDGPRFSDSYHDREWEDLSEEYPQRWDSCGSTYDYDSETSEFCWLHYLSLENAQLLGIAADGDQAVGHGADYPAWVSRLMAAESDESWIHSDRIQASYSKATAVVEPIHKICFSVGCGPEWDPEKHPDDQVDPEGGEWEQYPNNAGPLLRIEISRDQEMLPHELKALLPYVEKLQSLATQSC